MARNAYLPALSALSLLVSLTIDFGCAARSGTGVTPHEDAGDARLGSDSSVHHDARGMDSSNVDAKHNPTDAGDGGAGNPSLACTLPAAGALNVKTFGAVGDGVHDDTQAFLDALEQSSDPAQDWHVQIVCIPEGTYMVSAPITKRYADGGYNAGMALMGAGPGLTTIRLVDHAPAYQDPQTPEAVIFTSGKGVAQSPKNGYATLGEGDDGFSNFVENLTVDVGTTNPGAIGIDYLANNQGAVRNVSVTGNGAVGISMVRSWIGPALVKNVSVNGSAVGIDVGSDVFSVTLDSIRLTGQTTVALRNNSNLVSVHDLSINALGNPAEQALVNEADAGMIVVDTATLSADGDAGPGGGTAAVSTGWVNARHVTLNGYSSFLSHGQADGAPSIDGIFQGNTLVSASTPSWGGLTGPSEQSLFVYPDQASVSVTSFGAKGDGVTDCTMAFTSAFASGAPTVYIPFGEYVLDGNIDVPSSVDHVLGMNSTLIPSATRSATFSRTLGMLQTHNSDSPLLVEKIVFSSASGLQVAVEDMGTSPLMLRDIVGLGVSFQRDATGGDLYVEDVSGGFLLNLAGPAPVWGSQVDSEGGGARGGTAEVRIANSGAPLYILGAKSEGNNTLVSNTNGAKTDVLGAFTSPDGQGTVPMFSNVDSKMQVTGLELAFVPANNYATVLVDGTGASQATVLASTLPPRSGTNGFFMPQIVGTH